MNDIKTILIPTDFSVIGLTLIRSALEQFPHPTQIDILLVHGFRLNDSISDLLFFSKRKLRDELETDEFKNACRLLKNTYDDQIRSIKVDFMIGNGRRRFNNYLDVNNVDEIHYCNNLSADLPHKQSFDLVKLIKAINPAGRPIKSVKIESSEYRLTNQLSDLFQSNFTYAPTQKR